MTEAEASSLQQIRTELPDWVWQGAGISRDGNTLSTTSTAIAQLKIHFDHLPITQKLLACLQQPQGDVSQISIENLRLWSETRNLLDLAHLILKSATFREESRGGHYRQDHPETELEWQTHTLVQGDRWWRSAPVKPSHPIVKH